MNGFDVAFAERLELPEEFWLFIEYFGGRSASRKRLPSHTTFVELQVLIELLDLTEVNHGLEAPMLENAGLVLASRSRGLLCTAGMTCDDYRRNGVHIQRLCVFGAKSPYCPFLPKRPSIFRSMSVSGRFSMILPSDMGSERSLGDDLGGGVLDIDGNPSCGGRRPEFEEVDEPGMGGGRMDG